METFGMKRVIILAWVLFAVIASTSVFAGLEDDRFKGGGVDGYDKGGFLQTSTDLDLIFSRYKGGNTDGYANGQVLIQPIPPGIPAGTVIWLR